MFAWDLVCTVDESVPCSSVMMHRGARSLTPQVELIGGKKLKHVCQKTVEFEHPFIYLDGEKKVRLFSSEQGK